MPTKQPKPKGKRQPVAKRRQPQPQQQPQAQAAQPQRQPPPLPSPEQHAQNAVDLRTLAASEQDPQRRARLSQLADLNQSFSRPLSQPLPEEPTPAA